MSAPILLDLFCGAGGAAKGYHDAGFEVIGVDIKPMPRYPYTFIQGDALTVLDNMRWAAAYHASAPCHDHSYLRSLSGLNGTGHLLADVRAALDEIGKPYVVENVMGADMRPDLVLCGSMFGLRTYRHRQFELGGFTAAAPEHPEHTVLTATKQRRERWAQGWNVSITGDVGTYLGPEAMGIDWMTGNELCQAIPPAYTRHIGEQLMAELLVGAA